MNCNKNAVQESITGFHHRNVGYEYIFLVSNNLLKIVKLKIAKVTRALNLYSSWPKIQFKR